MKNWKIGEKKSLLNFFFRKDSEIFMESYYIKLNFGLFVILSILANISNHLS